MSEFAEELLKRAHQFRVAALTSPGGGDQEKTQFFELATRAAEMGWADAMLEVAVCYRDGTGVKRDRKLAFTWMEQAAEAGSEGAKLHMIAFHERGIGTRRDLAKATEWQARLKR